MKTFVADPEAPMASVVWVKYEGAEHARADLAGGRLRATGAAIGGPRLAVIRHRRRHVPPRPCVVRFESEGAEAELSSGADGPATRYPVLAVQVTTP
ncbi:hypothetical protein GCM10022226_04890 [Sphaerisporangium flaviroseum]|uniref:Uncharacterized protein n=1 Tax=Sphaerisporangium flaviroseum TaxID=509199 RepID=A0ABP7HFG5_9ACTN